MNFWIGTSGFQYAEWKGNFYPDDLATAKMLAFYAERFVTTEINYTFHRIPAQKTIENWRAQTPEKFRFALKAPQRITHWSKLRDCSDTLEYFCKVITGLGDRLGPVLFQLPPKWKINRGRLEEFLQALPPYHRYTFEFREQTWLCDEICQLLAKYNAAFCIYDIGGFHSPILTTADFAYVRLHGPGNKYQGSYSDRALKIWAKQIDQWYASGKSVFVYFDNDQAGYAAQNALTLKRMLRLESVEQAA